MAVYSHSPHADLPPPKSAVGVVGWLKKNLFSTPVNSILTVVALAFLCWTIPRLVEWSLINADWLGTTREDCSREGACWVFVIRPHQAVSLWVLSGIRVLAGGSFLQSGRFPGGLAAD